MLVVACKINSITNRYHLIIYYIKGKEERKERIFTIMSRARKTNLFTASCEEAKFKDFAILFLVLSWLHQGNHLCLLIIISKLEHTD